MDKYKEIVFIFDIYTIIIMRNELKITNNIIFYKMVYFKNKVFYKYEMNKKLKSSTIY